MKMMLGLRTPGGLWMAHDPCWTAQHVRMTARKLRSDRPNVFRVAQISKSAGLHRFWSAGLVRRPAGWKPCDTADLEICATLRAGWRLWFIMRHNLAEAFDGVQPNSAHCPGWGASRH